MEPDKNISHIAEMIKNISRVICLLKISVEYRRMKKETKRIFSMKKKREKRKEKIVKVKVIKEPRLTKTQKIINMAIEKRKTNPYYLQFLERNNNQ